MVIGKRTQQMWQLQNRHPGDRARLFGAVSRAYGPVKALYPGSYVDIAASFAFADVTYVDSDRRAEGFFADNEGVAGIIAAEGGAQAAPAFRFIRADYSGLKLAPQAFDLLISLYAGLVSDHCTAFLRVGGRLLANPSHGDVAMASIDPRYALSGVVIAQEGDYRVSDKELERYLIPKKPGLPTRDGLRASMRGIAYTTAPFAYVFTRIA